jgi:putative oxidoreductase
MRALVPIGRALFALVFIVSLFNHFSGSTIDYASAQGVPLATLVVPLTGLLAFVGGVMVLVGYRARFGAFLLFCFLVPVTLVMHAFWGAPDAATAAQEKAHFMKNLSLLGGTLLLMYFGSGPLSLDD